MINKVGRFCLAKGVKLVWLFHLETEVITDVQGVREEYNDIPSSSTSVQSDLPF